MEVILLFDWIGPKGLSFFRKEERGYGRQAGVLEGGGSPLRSCRTKRHKAPGVGLCDPELTLFVVNIF